MNTPTHRSLVAPTQALPLAILAFAAALAGGCSTSSGRVVARVDGEDIASVDLVHAAQSMPASALDPSPLGKRALLDELVSRALLVAEAKRRGYDRTPELAQTLIRAQDEILPKVLYDRLVGERVRVTEDEARAMWDRQTEEWRVSQIFSFTGPESRAAAERLRRGVTFAQVAQSASRDRQTGTAGGDLGYLTSGQIPREMEEAVRRLRVGQWAGPLQTPVGWYLVQVTDRRARKREPFDAIRENLATLLRQRKERTLVLSYVTRLKQRRHLTANPVAYGLLAEKWQNRSLPELLDSRGDPARLGFTPQELTMPVERWDGGAYTVKDFFQEMMERSGLDRPSSQDDAALHLYVEDRAVSRMIKDEARAMGLDQDPEAQQQLRDREDSYLITHLYEEVIVPSSQATAEEQERLRAQLSNVKGDADTTGLLAQVEARFLQAKRRQVLDQFLARLRREHPPKVNERALAAVPWPIAPKENS